MTSGDTDTKTQQLLKMKGINILLVLLTLIALGIIINTCSASTVRLADSDTMLVNGRFLVKVYKNISYILHNFRVNMGRVDQNIGNIHREESYVKSEEGFEPNKTFKPIEWQHQPQGSTTTTVLSDSCSSLNYNYYGVMVITVLSLTLNVILLLREMYYGRLRGEDNNKNSERSVGLKSEVEDEPVKNKSEGVSINDNDNQSSHGTLDGNEGSSNHRNLTTSAAALDTCTTIGPWNSSREIRSESDHLGLGECQICERVAVCNTFWEMDGKGTKAIMCSPCEIYFKINGMRLSKVKLPGIVVPKPTTTTAPLLQVPEPDQYLYSKELQSMGEERTIFKYKNFEITH